MPRKYNILVHWTFRPIRLRPLTRLTQQPARLGGRRPRASLSVSRKICKKWKQVHLGFMGAGIGGKCTFSDGTPTHICIHFIFIANKCIALHFPSNDIGLSSLKFFWWVPEFYFCFLWRGGVSAVQGHPRFSDIGANWKRGSTSY